MRGIIAPSKLCIMRSILAIAFLLFYFSNVYSQKTELYDLVNKLIPDSSGHENVGSWGIGKSRIYPVAWKANHIERSKDTSINFFRSGVTDVAIRKKSVTSPAKWTVMIKGARNGYTSFSIVSPPSKNLQPVISLDSIFGVKPFKVQLLKTCKKSRLSGFNYYKLKIPRKDESFLKVSWKTNNGKTVLRLDGYAGRSRNTVDLKCD